MTVREAREMQYWDRIEAYAKGIAEGISSSVAEVITKAMTKAIVDAIYQGETSYYLDIKEELFKGNLITDEILRKHHSKPQQQSPDEFDITAEILRSLYEQDVEKCKAEGFSGGRALSMSNILIMLLDEFNKDEDKSVAMTVGEVKRRIQESKAEGINEGLRKGLKEGIEKGLEKGLRKGIKEGKVNTLSDLKEKIEYGSISTFTELLEYIEKETEE